MGADASIPNASSPANTHPNTHHTLLKATAIVALLFSLRPHARGCDMRDARYIADAWRPKISPSISAHDIALLASVLEEATCISQTAA